MQAHIYVRIQVTASEAVCADLQQTVEALRQAVEAAGGEWHGGITLTGAAEPTPPPPAAPEPVDDEEDTSVYEDDDNEEEPTARPLSTASLRPRKKSKGSHK